jgi:ribosomal protein RSM22 (predicted rRNA methylase)
VRRKSSRIHQGLVGRRQLVGAPYMAEGELRQEYADQIAPRTRAALERVFERISARIAVATPHRVLDLGAGTGAVGETVRARWPRVEVVAVDRVAAPGILAADVTRGVRPAGVTGRFDLVIAAHLLNELNLDAKAKAHLVAGWCEELLAADGTCILIEPALRETSRALLEVRDRLLTGHVRVVAPCPVQGPCPALANPRDWCHDAAPAIVEGRSRVDFSYLVLRMQASTPDDDAYRICSDPLKDKGRLRFFACGRTGRYQLLRLDRDRSEANSALDQIARGDLVRISGAAVVDENGGDLRLGPSSRLTRA